MDKKRIYIIIIVCLVAVLEIGGVYMLFSNNTAKSTLTNVIHNNTTAVNNTTSIVNNNRTTSSINSGLISSQDAINIVEQNVKVYGGVTYRATLIQNGQNPYYEVYICENEPNTTDYGKNMEDAQVDATTGQVIGEKEIP